MTEAQRDAAVLRYQTQAATVQARIDRDVALGRGPAREDVRHLESIIGRATAVQLGDGYRIPWVRIGDGATA